MQACSIVNSYREVLPPKDKKGSAVSMIMESSVYPSFTRDCISSEE